MIESRKNLAKDDEGAIVVTGIFASAFLIGALWYLLGLGDAMLFKERMQNGADAVAFAPSVIHARGMNLIALLNIVMASVLAVFVAVKITQALVAIATVIACFDPFSSDCYYLAAQNAPYKNFVDKVEKKVDNINKSLSDAGNTVAKQMPILAAKRGADASNDYSELASGGFSASISQIPGDSEGGGGLADGSSGSTGGKRLGLPVEDDDYSNLCHHSGTMVDIVFLPTIEHYNDGMNLISKTMEYAGEFMPIFVNMNPSAWCGSGSSKPKSKRIYGPAQHGNDYFATWGFTTSSFVEDKDRGGPGLRVATWGHRPPGSEISQAELDKSLRKAQVSKSEFYYDPRRGGPKDWGGIKDEALWNLRWRARMRRVSQPNSALRSFFQSNESQIMMEARGGDASEIIQNVLCASPESLTAWTNENVGQVSATSRTGGIVH